MIASCIAVSLLSLLATAIPGGAVVVAHQADIHDSPYYLAPDLLRATPSESLTLELLIQTGKLASRPLPDLPRSPA